MYFKPSGKIDLVATPIAVIAALISTFLLAFVYTYAIWYIPIIYLNVIITGFAGVAMMFMIKKVCYYAKSRNFNFNLSLALISSVLFCYLNWGIWLDLVMNSTDSYNLGNTVGITVAMSSRNVFSLLSHPEVMYDYAKIINTVGTWGIKSIPVTGWFLTSIWVIEALILIGVPSILMLGNTIDPFCETHNEWSESEEINTKFKFIDNPIQLKQDLENAQFEELYSLKAASEGVLDYAKIIMYKLTRANVYYMSITNEIGKLDKEQKVSYTSEDVVKYLKISKDVYDFLKNYKPTEVLNEVG